MHGRSLQELPVCFLVNCLLCYYFSVMETFRRDIFIRQLCSRSQNNFLQDVNALVTLMTFLFLENVCVTLSLLLILFCLSSFRDSPVTPVAKSASITSRFWWLLISINMKSFITGKCSFLRDGANLAIAEQRWRHHIAVMVNLSLASPTNMVNVNKKRVGGEFESTCKDELGQIGHFF